jgi:AcrR family transcriptional regulator
MTPSTPARARSPRPRGRRTELSRERIIEAALEIATQGRDLDAVTMRELAESLGVGTMTLYGYFRTKDELIDATLDRAADEVKLPSPGGSWKAQLRGLVGEVYRVLRKYPAGVQVRARRPILSSGVLRTTDAAMGIMAAAGLDKRKAAHAWRVLFIYTFGFVAFTPEPVTDEMTREWRAQLATLDVQDLPWLVDALPEAIEAMTGSEQFYKGLDLILDGIERQLKGTSGR